MKKAPSILLSLVLCGSMCLQGCSTSWVSEAEQIVAALIPATANFVTLAAVLRGKTVSAADLATIQNGGTQAQADLQLIASLVTQYQKAEASAQPGILGEISTAVATANSNLNGILPALHITDTATTAKISAVIGLLLSEVQSLAAIVPLFHPGMTVKTLRLAVAQKSGHMPLSANDFVASFNATMTAKTGNPDVDKASAGLSVHMHSRLERLASAGVLK